ncbi:MAG: DUF3638 domain-containing protein [Chlamydiia bacterium]|nr:DUF3638 domain-containing protein [Chlamydiia bacterium]
MADALEAYAAQWKARVPLQSCIQTEADAVRAMDCIDQEMTSQGVMTLAAENEVGALLRGLSIRDQGAVEAELRQDWTLRSLILQLAQGTMPEVPHGLIDAVFRFLIHETEAQLAARAIQKLRHLMDRGNQIGFDHAECKDLAQDFASELKPRAYELRCDLETLQCLCFEWLSDKRLFVDQYEKLNTLDGNALLEFQAPTGSGKSSTIFPLLLWLVITRKSRELTVMTVRDSQLEDQLKLLRTLLGDAFDTAIQPFVVDREVLSRKAGIKRAKEVVTDAREERRIILTTPRSLHACLFLSPVEVADDRLLFESLAELRSLLTEGAIHFIDESKEVFDVSKSYTYSLGAPEPIDRETRKGVFSVYSQLVLNKALHSEWNFDFLAAYTAGKGKGITPENYAELRDTLIQRAPEALCSWLSGEPGLPEGIADHTYYTHLRYLLHQSFSVLLTSKYKVGYRRKRDLTAEPLEEGKPFPGMEFANPIQAVAFTVQANLAEPYTSSDLQPYVEAVKELLRSGNLRHPLARFWSEQIAPQIPQLPPPAELEDCAPLCELLNDPNRLELRLAFIQLYVLQHVVFSKEKIDSNPHIHIQALKRAIAASGTTRPETLPPQVESWRALDGVIHTLLRLWEGSQDKVTELVGAHAREKLQSVLAEPHHRVLIDAAGEFLKLDIQAIADEVFVSRPEAQALVYYNDEGQLLALLRDGGESIPHHSCALEENHLYYMLHRRYAIGADLPLPMDIQGFVTVDRLCDTALLVQAVGRLRHLGRGQVAHIGGASEDCNAILSNLGRKESKPRLTDILLWAAIVEGQDKGRQFYQALGAFLSAHESEVFWDLATPWTRALPSLRALLTRKVSSSVQSRENEDLHLQPAKDVVESLLEERLGIWKDCGAENSKLCSGEFIEAYRSYADLTKLPAYLPLGQAEPGRCVTTQQEGVAQKYGHAQQVGLEDAQRSAWNLQRVKMHYRGGSHREWIESSDVLDLGDCEVRFSPRALGVAVAWGGCTDVEAVCPEFVVRRNRRDGTISVLALGAEDSPDVVCKMKNANSVPAEDFDYYLLNASGCVAADAAVPYEVVKKELEGNGTLALAMKLLSGNHLLSGKEEELWMQLRRESPKFLEHLRKVAPLRPKLRRLLEL